MFANTLHDTSTTIIMRADLSGFKLYSIHHTKGWFAGSYVRVQASSAIFNKDCGVILVDQRNPTLANNYLYCIVVSTSVLEIRSSADITLNGVM